jgi:twitching motility protein PilT
MASVPDLIDFLRLTVDWDGSDLHLKAGGPGYVRVSGQLCEVTHLGRLLPADTAAFVEQILPDSQRAMFAAGREADFAYSVPGLGRFRVAVFRQRGSVGLVLRRVRPGSQTLDELQMPAAVRKLAEEHRGLLLVTGPTGAGKTTTTAAMVGHINSIRRCHIVTVEDPIEILHNDNLAIVDQREVGVDTPDFAAALRSVARQDPDVIFIGEMRDLETVNRIIDMYPPYQQKQARLSLANTLRGVVSQRLVPTTSGGLVAVIEVLVMTTRLREFVLDADRTDLIPDAIAEGEYYGMQTFDQHLLQLYSAGVVSMDAALDAATSPHDFRIAARGNGAVH